MSKKHFVYLSWEPITYDLTMNSSTWQSHDLTLNSPTYMQSHHLTEQSFFTRSYDLALVFWRPFWKKKNAWYRVTASNMWIRHATSAIKCTNLIRNIHNSVKLKAFHLCVGMCVCVCACVCLGLFAFLTMVWWTPWVVYVETNEVWGIPKLQGFSLGGWGGGSFQSYWRLHCLAHEADR